MLFFFHRRRAQLSIAGLSLTLTRKKKENVSII